MSDNPQYGTTPLFALPDLGVVGLHGRDAVAFAQAQFMNDVAALETGRWQWNGWLDPKGRVQALFLLLRTGDDALLAVTASDVPALAEALRRFVFRSKVTVSTFALHAAGALRPPHAATGDRIAGDDGALELDLSGEGGARTLRLQDAPVPADHAAAQAWWALDLRHGWPGIPGARLDAWTPQQLSLQRFPAFSVRKGCYPGQEIVARTHFLGRAKREAALFEIVAGERSGDELRADDGALAGVVAQAGAWCLAVAPMERPAGPWHAGAARLVERPLLGGLARPAVSVS